MTPIEALTERVDALEASLLQMQRNLTPIISKADNAYSMANALTPYTDTKKAYYGEKEKIFYNVPLGNMLVYFDNYGGSYGVNRVADRVIISFDTLTQETNVTISIS